MTMATLTAIREVFSSFMLSELFKGVSDAEKAQRLSSQIPVGTRLRSARSQ